MLLHLSPLQSHWQESRSSLLFGSKGESCPAAAPAVLGTMLMLSQCMELTLVRRRSGKPALKSWNQSCWHNGIELLLTVAYLGRWTGFSMDTSAGRLSEEDTGNAAGWQQGRYLNDLDNDEMFVHGPLVSICHEALHLVPLARRSLIEEMRSKFRRQRCLAYGSGLCTKSLRLGLSGCCA